MLGTRTGPPPARGRELCPKRPPVRAPRRARRPPRRATRPRRAATRAVEPSATTLAVVVIGPALENDGSRRVERDFGFFSSEHASRRVRDARGECVRARLRGRLAVRATPGTRAVLDAERSGTLSEGRSSSFVSPVFLRSSPFGHSLSHAGTLQAENSFGHELLNHLPSRFENFGKSPGWLLLTRRKKALSKDIFLWMERPVGHTRAPQSPRRIAPPRLDRPGVTAPEPETASSAFPPSSQPPVRRLFVFVSENEQKATRCPRKRR